MKSIQFHGLVEKCGITLVSYLVAKEIVETIEKSQQMTSLQMMGNTMGVEAAEVISKALAKHPEFEVSIIVKPHSSQDCNHGNAL